MREREVELALITQWVKETLRLKGPRSITRAEDVVKDGVVREACRGVALEIMRLRTCLLTGQEPDNDFAPHAASLFLDNLLVNVREAIREPTRSKEHYWALHVAAVVKDAALQVGLKDFPDCHGNLAMASLVKSKLSVEAAAIALTCKPTTGASFKGDDLVETLLDSCARDPFYASAMEETQKAMASAANTIEAIAEEPSYMMTSKQAPYVSNRVSSRVWPAAGERAGSDPHGERVPTDRAGREKVDREDRGVKGGEGMVSATGSRVSPLPSFAAPQATVPCPPSPASLIMEDFAAPPKPTAATKAESSFGDFSRRASCMARARSRTRAIEPDRSVAPAEGTL